MKTCIRSGRINVLMWFSIALMYLVGFAINSARVAASSSLCEKIAAASFLWISTFLAVLAFRTGQPAALAAVVESENNFKRSSTFSSHSTRRLVRAMAWSPVQMTLDDAPSSGTCFSAFPLRPDGAFFADVC
ncbi:hypothetical protein BOTBODRAFT_448007 [Botryobasidium botryosum FD-172 SS1]|uniref:Uncharacterized protein n=1 Tax=Botryobasidium botryosum (strain FD-172 SS1) TaxID=930990 RepID=A0A067M8H2_BOTB1|nr:hypothetical protein BOTBODRAFT_448007 [Botryobasidium botryosum FD-172 SS1]